MVRRARQNNLPYFSWGNTIEIRHHFFERIAMLGSDNDVFFHKSFLICFAEIFRFSGRPAF
jgi:hypothetical protein